MRIKMILGAYIAVQVYVACAEQINFVDKLGAHVPIAKYDDRAVPASITAEQSRIQARHIRRDAYYDHRRPGPLKDPGPGGLGGVEVPITHWDANLSAIPAQQSDVIVLGEIIAAQAHVSQARVSVYSEFTIRIKSVFKNTTPTAIAVGSTITADRPVGGVEFPSGTVGHYGQVGMGAPEVGKAYVLFLAAHEQSQDFRIVTGFELKDDKVYAMDGMRAMPAAGRHRSRFDEYHGTDQATFLDLVRKYVASAH